MYFILIVVWQNKLIASKEILVENGLQNNQMIPLLLYIGQQGGSVEWFFLAALKIKNL